MSSTTGSGRLPYSIDPKRRPQCVRFRAVAAVRRDLCINVKLENQMQIFRMRCVRVAACLLPLGALAAAAQTTDDADENGQLEEIVVTAHPLAGEALSEAVAVLDGEVLEQAITETIGATVARQPGIHSASFGEAVGRPVIHGMSGPRVRVMEDRIDVMDVSVTSGDHAVTTDPFVAERVEVIKGPSALLYGSGAIGGVVDVQTGRIPREQRQGVEGRGVLRAADNGNATGGALRLDGGGGAFSWHVDGFYRDSDEYDIPGFAESARRHAAEEHEEDEHHDEDEHHGEDEDEHHDEDEDEHHEEEEEEVFGVLPGSDAKARGGAFGFSWVGERGFAGLAASRLDYDYGLPGGTHAHEHEEHHDEDEEHHEGEDEHHEGEDEHHEEEAEGEEGTVTLALEQTRVDFETAFAEPFGDFASLNVRIGRNDYEHLEIEPNAEIGTRFANRSHEGRVELVRNASGWRSVFGMQFGQRDFSALGEEAFVPPVQTNTLGAFWLGERPVGRFELETGARAERVRHTPSVGPEKRFTMFSASVGVAAARDAFSLGVHGGYSARAPGAEEMYSNGAHLATQTFEIGDPNLDAEKALRGAVTLAWRGERGTVHATAYLAAWQDYIYQFATGEMEDELPVLRYGQEDAFHRGLDLQARFEVAQFGGGSLAVSGIFDTVAATIDVSGNDQLPRIPPARAGVGLHLERGQLRADLDYLRVFDQNDVADFELPTDGYDDLRLYIAVDLPVSRADARIFLHGRNLTDAEQRHHTSYVKDLAPARGRTLELGVRMAF